MEHTSIEFDEALARRYRKAGRALAFPSDSAFLFHKSWGNQFLWQHSWVMIPLINGHPSRDIYGCSDEEFRATYKPVGAEFPHTYEKIALVDAYQPGMLFTVQTAVRERDAAFCAMCRLADEMPRLPVLAPLTKERPR